ncbi:GNAT family N-acetyltransferase [Cellulomonas sp.]|uniref:GNAT family N-acetyltransferase n=1 Tax=Cellulomonas sp. TaxID=40001 RepID=UPI002810C14A|nr:GNAT family N-acetyltransferase [Cellulomonas sp.]
MAGDVGAGEADASTSVRVDVVPWDDPDARLLRDAQQAELRERYGEDDIGHDMTGEAIAVMLVLRADGEAVACGALRDATDLGTGTGELKRMYVRPSWRGRGLSRRVLEELEAAARERGFGRLVLETGVLQPEAIGLYLSAGYRPVPRWGEYADAPDSRCFAKDLTAPGTSSPAPEPPEVTVVPVRRDDPDAAALRRAMAAELAARGPGDGRGLDDADLARSDAEAGEGVLATLLARLDGEAVGCVAVRRAPAPWPDGWAEVRCLYVSPPLRGRGAGRRLLTAAQEAARARGCTAAVLATGVLPPTSVGLYLALGYRPVRPAVDWSATPDLLWFARPL